MGPRLKVLLFDPEDLSHASPADAAAAVAAAAASSSSFRAASPGDAADSASTAAAAVALVGKDGPGAGPGVRSGPASYPITISSSSSGGNGSSSSNGLSDIGGVEVDVQRLLSAARQGRGVSPPGVAGKLGSIGSVKMGTAAATASWEGWVKLDKVRSTVSAAVVCGLPSPRCWTSLLKVNLCSCCWPLGFQLLCAAGQLMLLLFAASLLLQVCGSAASRQT
jgi:hypothetical protein